MFESAGRGLYSHVGVHFAQSVADCGEVAAQVLDHVLDAPCVFEEVDALSVRVVVNGERTLYCFGKLPEKQEKRQIRVNEEKHKGF